MTVQTLKNKFNRLVRELNNNRRLDMGFSTVVEAGYEALVLAQVMKEYSRIYGPATKVAPRPVVLFSTRNQDSSGQTRPSK